MTSSKDLVEKRDFDGWNRSTLRSSRHSTVWVYQQFALWIGEVREKEHLTDSVWQRRPVRRCRSLRSTAPSGFQPWNRWISCENRIETSFPFKVEHQRLVKDIMIVEAGRD